MKIISVPRPGGMLDVVFDGACVHAIEDEIMPVTVLLARLRPKTWSFTDIVTAAHILLQSVAQAPDYLQLSEHFMRHGSTDFRSSLERALNDIVS